jgi:pimeloyl-ACP methyl ester carboxylesterase
MFPFISQTIDRIAIHHAAAHMAKLDGRDLRLEEGQELVRKLDSLAVAPEPAKVEFDGAGQFHFASPRPSPHDVNNIVPGRWYPCGENWQSKPTVILVHGWNDRLNHYFFFPRHARKSSRLGINVATLQMPWQFDRRPPGLNGWGDFLCADILHVVNAALQGLADIRALIGWLTAQSSPFIGLWGVSMGAWLSGLATCHDARIGCAVLTVPVARLDSLLEKAAFCDTIRAGLNGRHIEMGKLNLIANRPIIPPENVLLLEAEYDRFVPKVDVEELSRLWNGSEIWRYPYGHISILCAPGFWDRVTHWIAQKANARAAK